MNQRLPICWKSFSPLGCILYDVQAVIRRKLIQNPNIIDGDYHSGVDMGL